MSRFDNIFEYDRSLAGAGLPRDRRTGPVATRRGKVSA